MEIYNTQYSHGVHGIQGPHRMTNTQETANTRSATMQDEARFSDEALMLSGINQNSSSSSPIRFDLVNRVKAEIAAGTYDTADKIDIAMTRMLGRLNPR